MAKFPGPVTFDDGTQYCKLFLTVPGLKVGGLMSKTAKNGDIQKQFGSGSIRIQITVGGETYVYQKSLPEDINPGQSKVELERDGQVVVKLYKASAEPWSAHSRHLVLP